MRRLFNGLLVLVTIPFFWLLLFKLSLPIPSYIIDWALIVVIVTHIGWLNFILVLSSALLIIPINERDPIGQRMQSVLQLIRGNGKFVAWCLFNLPLYVWVYLHTPQMYPLLFVGAVGFVLGGIAYLVGFNIRQL